MATKPNIPDFPELPDVGNMIAQACELIANIRGIPYDFNGTLSLENKFTVLFKTVQEMFKAQDSLIKSYKELYEFINTYFDNLDVQEEVNKKIQSMADDGSLLALIAPTIETKTGEWLETNITNPSNPPIDKSLTVENAAADAKIVGTYALLSSRSNITDSTFDLNNAEPNRIYVISTVVQNSPNSTSVGVCWSFSLNNAATSTYAQFFHTTDNNLYYRYNDYNGGWTSWKMVGVNNDVINFMSSALNITWDSFDLNDCERNRIYLISTSVQNAPNVLGGVCWSFAQNNTAESIYSQFFHSPDNNLYYRFKTYTSGWTSWKNVNDAHKEYFYDMSLFQTVGVIGDSYASGELYSNSTTNVGDIFAISWLQQLARKFGFKGINFSKGGLSTRSWLTDSNGLPLLNSSDPCDLILLCLGINDYYHLGENYLGTPSDMDTLADSFYGNYAKIINSVKTKNEKTRMIIFTIADPDKSTTINKFNDAIKNIASKFTIPCADENSYEYFKSDLFSKNMIGGHPIAVNYNGMGVAINNIISDTMQTNQYYFNELFL